MAGSTKRITERFALTGGTVDRTGKYPVIRGALLCGPTSTNKRRYKSGAFGTKRYEGMSAFIDHGESARGARSFRDKIGWIENERRREDGMPIGDIGVNPEHPEAKALLWAVENRPDFAGMSHVASCRTTVAADGWEDVEEVIEVESVDFVVGAATTKGFFEQGGRSVATKKFREVLEGLRSKFTDAKKQSRVRKFLLLCEDDAGMSGLMDAPVDEPAEGGDPDDALLQGFKAAIDAVWTQYTTDKDGAAAIKAIGKYIKAHAKLNTGGDEPAEEPAEEKPAEEQKKNDDTAFREAFQVCEMVAFRPSTADLKVIANTPAADRKTVAERLKQLTEGSSGTGKMSQSRDEFHRAEPKVGADGKQVKETKEPALMDGWDIG